MVIATLTGLLAPIVVTASRAADTAPGNWRGAGTMERPRSGHTSTVLPDGRVLLAGGGDGNVLVATSEVFDPVTRTWARAGDMREGRAWHTATLLGDGRVLVVGGCAEPACSGTNDRPDTALASAELFDPDEVDQATGRLGKWSDTGGLLAARYGHTATLLGDGRRVLVVGGCHQGGRGEGFCGPNVPHLASAELYDPTTPEPTTGRLGKWSRTGDLTEPEGRALHTATLLPDGKVLVAGGRLRLCNLTSRTSTATAETYDPEAGTWQPTTPMAVARFWHSATALRDGRVLVAGGVAGYPDNGQPVCQFGPRDAPRATAEIYEPTSQTWQPAASMEGSGRFLHAAALLPQSGKVLMTGGNTGRINGQDFPLDTVELFDPAGLDATTGLIGSWRRTGSLITGRARQPTSSLLMDGTVLVAGGVGFQGESSEPRPLAGAEIFDAALTTRPPSVIAVSPSSEPSTSGGVSVALSGAGFTGATHVRFGDRDSAFTVRSDNEIVANSPPVDGPGTVHVTVTRQDGSQAPQKSDTVNTALYTYGGTSGGSRPPFLAGVRPGTGPAAGGTAVTITGTDLGGVTEVVFGATTAQFIVQSNASLLAAAPAGTGTVEVRVRSATGLSLTKGTFTYIDGSSSWSGTGRLALPRLGHTMTALSGGACASPAPASYCGKVLVVGGADPVSGASTSAEFWDPTTGQWCREPDPDAVCPEPLNNARHLHAATPLNDGRVLVVGSGFTKATETSLSAELYDPATGRWEEIGGPTFRRGENVTATLLRNDTVLVVGGTDVAAPVSEPAEIFDPATKKWAVIDGMTARRRQYTATRLLDGRVLVVGGAAGGAELNSAEIFDPATKKWRPTAALAQGRSRHTATLLGDGKVLVAGGCCSANRPLSSAEMFDPAASGGAGAWTTVGSLGTPRQNHTASRLASGEVLLAGGCCTTLASSELYDPANQQFVPTASLVTARKLHTATPLADGRVLVAGGVSPGGDIMQSAETYSRDSLAPQIGSIDPTVLRRLEPSAGPPAGGTAVRFVGRGLHFPGQVQVTFDGVPAKITYVSDGFIVAVSPPSRGGRANGPADAKVVTPAGTLSASFTYASGTWSGSGSGEPGPHHTATLLPDGKVLVAGGLRPGYTGPCRIHPCNPNFGSTPHRNAWLYDPSTGHSSSTTSMTEPRSEHSATLLANGKVLVAGGTDENDLADRKARTTAEIYDPVTKTWTPTGALAERRFAHSATLLPDGKVLVAGGASAEFGRVPVATAELFDPNAIDVPTGRKGTWASAGRLNDARGNHTATLLQGPECRSTEGPDHCGKVMVAAGVGDSAPEDRVATLGDQARSYNRGLLDSAELYDPIAKAWTRTGSLATPRFGHTATVLPAPRCGSSCGHVFVVGGQHNVDGTPLVMSSVEVYDPRAAGAYRTPGGAEVPVVGGWRPTGSMRSGRAGHSATPLPSGNILVVGRTGVTPTEWGEPDDSAETYDPATETWTGEVPLPAPEGGWPTFSLGNGHSTRNPAVQVERAGSYTATLLDGPACLGAPAPDFCGTVFFSGAGRRYTAGPKVAALSPATGPSAGGATVKIAGIDFRDVKAVRFGDAKLLPALEEELRAGRFRVDSRTQITAIVPRHAPGKVTVAVDSSEGTSAVREPTPAHAFTFEPSLPPGAVTGERLLARAVSESQILLTWPATTNDADSGSPASRYVVKQSNDPITEANFDSATTLCGTECSFTPTEVGQELELLVGDLGADTTYHYALRPINDFGTGPITTGASARTFPGPAVEKVATCTASGAPAAGQLSLPGGAYSLVGLPRGTVLGAGGPLYSWRDLGAGGSYAVAEPTTAVEGGQGYWAWFACPKVIDLAAGSASATQALGAYHASMVGNPSAKSPATVTGHDFAAAWDPSLNAGAGGYRVSGYREAQPLAVGEGLWVFAYSATTVDITAG